MLEKGFIYTYYEVKCTCGYSESLNYVMSRDASTAAKKQGWEWDTEKGWKCPTCIKNKLKKG